jgi:hypothetical protein
MNFKSWLFPKRNRFENTLKLYAVFSPENSNIKMAPTHRLFNPKDLSYISSGINARVFKMKNSDWVVKEGRWDLDINLFGDAKLPLPAQLTEKLLSIFSFTLLPSIKEILRQYKAYLKFVQYFGYFEKDDSYYHPNKDLIFNAQKNIRDSLVFYRDDLEKHYKIDLGPDIDRILNSEVKYHNFLPKEYLLVGKSISKENRNKTTYFIVQEYVKGTLMHDYDDSTLSPEIRSQLILLVYLILLMNYQIHLVPDTRPRYPIIQIDNWLTKTDNIMLNNKEVKFIDTRWLWDYNSNIIKRGLFIPDMIVNISKSYLIELLKDINNVE